MNDATQPFRVDVVDYAPALPDLRTVRETVFVQEQQVPIEEEWDALDPDCVHVLARSFDGTPIGTGRLTPEHKIGRMAVLRDWRGNGVGDAMLLALIEAAHQRGWREVSLHAQVSAIDFYLRHGFQPYGERFWEAGIEHQSMRRSLAGPKAIDDRETAIATIVALVDNARRGLWIYTRELDPGLFDHPAVVDAFRRFGTSGRGVEAHFLLQDAAAPQRAHAPLLALAQRLPSIFLFREVDDPVDRAYPSAYLANDAGGCYFRTLGHRFDGEADLHAPGRARQLRMAFMAVWERARTVSEYRVLGI
ncbi:GNAT family acetyltransferase [Lysobacter helvus]|uniref:GNAT family acetyltransferase n=2 Tax=Lysobacteraceae TaxID=32033 RepID=A0ABN6FW95_9GAMM|nr:MULTISPECIES: GNAT family N-acetyltransferase [Lysobacter]BCT94012.1 GNAT family acetyltransferase [Lysobacter caseinilyticus]BCT97168.1 GNAT family acetyltransferase [Lysobacter helvus]